MEDPAGPVMVIAHRACWRNSAENSIQAIDHCVELGVDMVEIDARRTRDGQLVVIHDSTLDRTTSGSGAVADSTLAQIQQLRLKQRKGGADAGLTDQGVPTLEQALRHARDRILVNVDAKEDIYDDIARLLDRMQAWDQVLVKGKFPPGDPALSRPFYRNAIYFMPIVEQSDAGHPLSALVRGYPAKAPIAFEVVYESEDFLREGMESIRTQRARVWVNTLKPELAGGVDDDQAVADPEGNWGRLIEMGVNMLQTDRPDELIRYLQQTHRR